MLSAIGYFVWIMTEMKTLWLEKKRRDFWVNVFLGAVGFTVIALLCLDVKIPSPEKYIREFITSIFGE